MNDKIKKELEEFKIFKKGYIFKQKEITYDGLRYYCDGQLLEDEDGNKVPISNKWINVGYNLKEPLSKALSNLFHYEFMFRGKQLNSIESFFQGIKIKDKNVQEYAFKYSGIESNYIKVCSDCNWQDEQIIYWDGIPYERNSKEYDDLVDELYISAIQNPLYRNALKNTDKEVIHSIGKENKNETVFTRYEFEYMLNCLIAFLKNKEL